MIERIDSTLKKHPYFRRTLEALMVLFMALYPLRHIHVGLDLWDTGYNYANFEYMGLDSMDSMWFFSTYLSTALGHLLTLLPFGKTLLGLNFYTALVISLLSITAYMFLTRIVKLPKFIAFLGEYIAISLCWCPTALMYNYLTYYFLMMAVICLYFGLWKKRRHCLFVAGVFLGLNVFVRFSNLPEAVLIFAVWVYGILETEGKIKTESGNVKRRERRSGFKKTTLRTLLCMGGYASAVGGMLLFFGIKYGFGAYFNAIKRLFAMTDEASDYTAMSMIRTIINWYQEAGYWFSRLCVFAIAGILVCALAKHLDIQFELKENIGRGIFGRRFNFLGLAYLISIILAALSIVWLYKKKFSFGNYGEYGSILLPSAVLLLLSVIVCIYQIFKPHNGLNMRLLSGLILIVILITPIGSNTGIFPIINNQFLVAPFLIYNFGLLFDIKEGSGISRYNYDNPLIRHENNKRRKVSEIIWSYVSMFPVKAGLIAFCILSFVQITTFGKEFVFTESKNAWDTYYSVGSDKVMNGIRMNYDKASNYAELYAYITEAELSENELITYGNIPALSFYLQMPSAFNPWIDLASYNATILEQDLKTVIDEAETKINEQLNADAGKLNVIKDNIETNQSDDLSISRTRIYPVIIVDVKYEAYIDIEKAEQLLNDDNDKLEEAQRKEMQSILTDKKWILLTEFIKEAGYEVTFTNGKYAVLVATDAE